MRFLRNKETGQVMHWNKHIAKLKVMVPCEAPGKAAPIEAPRETEETEEQDELLSKTEGEALVLEWFGRTVDKVKVKDLYDYAKEKTGEDFPGKMTKLQIVTKLAADLKE